MDEEFSGGLKSIAADFETLVQMLDDVISTGTFETMNGDVDALRRAKAAAERAVKLARQLPHRSNGLVLDFRLQFFDAAGAVAYVYEFQAPDVDAALSVAEGRRGLSAMELWSGERQVRRWDCFPPE